MNLFFKYFNFWNDLRVWGIDNIAIAKDTIETK